MASKTVRNLRLHLFLFDPEYPIKKGFVARLFLDKDHAEVFKEVKNVVQTAEPDKRLNEDNLSENLHRFKEILEDKHSTNEWPSLTRFFIEPFPIAFDNFPVLIDHLQPVLKSETLSSRSTVPPDNSRAPSPEIDVTEESFTTSTVPPDNSRVPSPEIDVTEESFTTSTVPPDNSRAPSPEIDVTEESFTTPYTPVNSCVNTPSRTPSPWDSESDCETREENQRENMAFIEDNTLLQSQLEVLNMPIYEKEEHSKNALQRLHDMVKKKASAACTWKDKYIALKNTTKSAQRKWEMLQILEEKVRVLEDELCGAQAEIETQNEIISYLNHKLDIAEK